MDTLTTTSKTSNRKRLQLLMASLTAFLLLMSIVAPGADAQTRDTKNNTTDTAAVLAATGCPDGFVEGRFGCVPENLTTKPGGVDPATEGCPDGWVASTAPGGCSPGSRTTPSRGDDTNGCPDKWVVSSAPGGCSPGYFTIAVNGVEFDDGCPDKWVVSSAPGGCSPEFLTLKLVGLEFDNGCPDNWVPSSAPGGCSPGFITIDNGGQIFEAQHHCAFGAACDAMIEAVLALGGECGHSIYGDTCTVPTGPDGRD